MKLSEDEERALAELEMQFHTTDAPAFRHFFRMALSGACCLVGVALVAAAQHATLTIALAYTYGFSTASIASGVAVSGYIMLLASAFVFGRAWEEFRQIGLRRFTSSSVR